MYSIEIKDTTWTVVSQYECNDSLIHDDYINLDLIHQVYVSQMANKRYAIASTKNRALVHGSTRKLYKQKGTGSARVGSKKSPIRRWGWVAFWPTSARNFTQKINKKMSRAAVRWLLTSKIKDKAVVWLTGLALTESKTKQAVQLLSSLSLSWKVLLVMDKKQENIEKSFRNIPTVKYILASYLNPRDLMHFDTILVMEDALDSMKYLHA